MNLRKKASSAFFNSYLVRFLLEKKKIYFNHSNDFVYCNQIFLCICNLCMFFVDVVLFLSIRIDFRLEGYKSIKC